MDGLLLQGRRSTAATCLLVAAPQGLSDIKDPKAPSENNSYVALSDLTLQGYGVPTHIISR